MRYHSTRCDAQTADSCDAVIRGLAPDGGLYMPQALPAFDAQACLQKDVYGMATQILSAFLPDIPAMEELVQKAYVGKFSAPDLTPPWLLVIFLCWSCSMAPPPPLRMWRFVCCPS